MVGNSVAFSIPCGTDLEWRRIQRVLHMVAHKHRFLCVFDFCVSMVYDLFVYYCRHELQIRSSEKDEQTICCGADKKLVIPFFFGLLALVPVMTYTAEVFFNGYTDTYWKQYGLFFTKKLI